MGLLFPSRHVACRHVVMSSLSLSSFLGGDTSPQRPWFSVLHFGGILAAGSSLAIWPPLLSGRGRGEAPLPYFANSI